jgi:hypothetical protein
MFVVETIKLLAKLKMSITVVIDIFAEINQKDTYE